jgi:hypothetical protein
MLPSPITGREVARVSPCAIATLFATPNHSDTFLLRATRPGLPDLAFKVCLLIGVPALYVCLVNTYGDLPVHLP